MGIDISEKLKKHNLKPCQTWFFNNYKHETIEDIEEFWFGHCEGDSMEPEACGNPACKMRACLRCYVKKERPIEEVFTYDAVGNLVKSLIKFCQEKCS